MRRLLTMIAATSVLALASVAAPNASHAAARHGYYHHHHHYGWRVFHGSSCDFRNFSHDRQLPGTC
jgi:Spy/CpxP family protein refolding chaperone